MVKGDRPDLVVRALTEEVGIDRIVPLHCARSVVRWSGPAPGGPGAIRARRAQRGHAEPSRVWLPEVSDVHDLADLLAGSGDVALAVPGAIEAADRPTVLVGPEGADGPPGNWRSVEGRWARSGLGPHVLRSETAAIAAAVLLVALPPPASFLSALGGRRPRSAVGKAPMVTIAGCGPGGPGSALFTLRGRPCGTNPPVVKNMETENPTGEDGAGSPRALVGQRLRSIRAQKKLSLDAVEELSNGEFKASVLGAYER